MRNRKQVTVNDVARFAGVSQSTVSRVLNQSSHIQPETRAKVKNAIRHLGYLSASMAATPGRKNALGVLLCPLRKDSSAMLSQDFFVAVLAGMQEIANHNSLEILLLSTMDSGTSLLLTEERRKTLLGIVLLGFPEPELISNLEELQIPFVQVGSRNHLAGFTHDTVEPNYIEAELYAGRYLLSRGYTRFGFFLPKVFSERVIGFRLALEEVNRQLLPGDIHLTDSTDTDELLEQLELVLKSGDVPPVMVVGFYPAALAFEAKLAHFGIRVPEDVLLLTYGHSPSQSQFPVLYLQPELFGRKAVLRLIEKNAIGKHCPHRIVINMQLFDPTNNDSVKTNMKE